MPANPVQDTTDFVEMSDEEDAAFDAALRDPSTISTHDRAVSILEVLEHEIAGIAAQVEAAKVEAAVAPLPPQRQEWLRRACYALSIRMGQRHKVMQRDRELRGVVFRQQNGPKEPGEGLAKQARLRAEAEARKAAKQAEAERNARLRAEAGAMARAAKEERLARQAEMDAERRRSFASLFVDAAREALSPQVFRALSAEAEKRRSAVAGGIDG